MVHTGHKGRIIVSANQKGGVGKTTTSHALVTGLTHKGYKALAVDADPQGNLTYTMAAKENEPGVYEVLKGAVASFEAIQNTAQGDIIGGNLMLSSADIEFTDTGREYLLAEALEPLRYIYDYIVIDSPPTLGILTINALTAAQDLIIPMGTDAYSIQGLSQLHTTIGKVKKHCNPNLVVVGILITRYSGRTILSRELKDAIQNQAAQAVNTTAFKTIIREGIVVKEIQTQQESLYTASPRSNATKDYMDFVDEYLERSMK